MFPVIDFTQQLHRHMQAEHLDMSLIFKHDEDFKFSLFDKRLADLDSAVEDLEVIAKGRVLFRSQITSLI